MRWVGWRGLLRLGVLEVKGRRVGLDDAGVVVGRIKAAAVAVRGLLRIRARVPRIVIVPSMVVRKRRRLDEGRRRREREQLRLGEEEEE